MSEIVNIKFTYGENEKQIAFPKSTTVKECLTKFLQETNSPTDLDTSKITFYYGQRLLNSDQYLNDKNLYDIKIKNNHNIKVTDTSNIIGGFSY